MNTLKSLEEKRRAASQKLEQAMLSRHPLDSAVRVYLNPNQYRPSLGDVIAAHGSDGTYRVRLRTINRRGYRTVKGVHWSKVESDV